MLHLGTLLTGTLIAPAPTETVSAPLPTFSHIRSPDYPAAYGVTDSARENHRSHVNQPAERVGTSGDDGRRDDRGSGDGPSDGWRKVDSSRPPAPAPPPGRLVGLLEGMAEVDLARLEARLTIHLVVVVVAVETDRPMSMACFLLICVLHVRRLMMKFCARDVDEIAPAHQPGIACHASIDVARIVALTR